MIDRSQTGVARYCPTLVRPFRFVAVKLEDLHERIIIDRIRSNLSDVLDHPHTKPAANEELVETIRRIPNLTPYSPWEHNSILMCCLRLGLKLRSTREASFNALVELTCNPELAMYGNVRQLFLRSMLSFPYGYETNQRTAVHYLLRHLKNRKDEKQKIEMLVKRVQGAIASNALLVRAERNTTQFESSIECLAELMQKIRARYDGKLDVAGARI